ncbi:Phytoene/squalene synthetase [Rhodovulum sp. ES.010]|uniref:squalene/phytoene synthase family protein n=1 Tax=Rhodovulum sp. ES.010 TaxID=1882821 RepID=UPI0009270C9E|nr:squalene/phytoene synthase family protein [Rhodovulum sp. ES.010]SIO14828.1 Phytoene/squalene synthetase [Rhodovulum sp. ES.010]
MSLDACAEIVRRGDPDRFRAVMAAPMEIRARLLPLYAFNVEVSRAPWVTDEPMIAEMRLQWWRDVLEEIAAGGRVRWHEVATPLAEVLAPAEARLLDGLVVARRWDAYREPFSDEAEFEAHVDACFGHLMWAAARALGADRGQEALRHIAHAQGVAAWLVAVPELEARGRVPLVDGRPEAVAALATRALARLGAARRAGIPAVAIPAARAAWFAPAVLQRAAKAPGRVADGRLQAPEVARRGALLWRAVLGRW